VEINQSQSAPMLASPQTGRLSALRSAETVDAASKNTLVAQQYQAGGATFGRP